MKTLKTTILADGFLRLDAPRWHAGSLWVSDTLAGKVYCVDLDGVSRVIADVREQPMGIGFLPDGSTLVSSMRDRKILRLDRARQAVHADFGDMVDGYLRDLAVDREGYAFAASFDSSGRAPECCETARIILATPDGSTRIVAGNLAYPNGLALTENHRLLVAETLGSRVLAFDVGEEHDLLQAYLCKLRPNESDWNLCRC
jgi:sugar lactone lactonase YvrE